MDRPNRLLTVRAIVEGEIEGTHQPLDLSRPKRKNKYRKRNVPIGNARVGMILNQRSIFPRLGSIERKMPTGRIKKMAVRCVATASVKLRPRPMWLDVFSGFLLTSEAKRNVSDVARSNNG
jgi:hypothetical protein